MKGLNNLTSNKDTVRLVDGTEVGKKEPTIKYDNLSGEIMRMLKTVVSHCSIFNERNPSMRYPYYLSF